MSGRRLVLVGEAPSGESIADRPGLALTGSSGVNLCRIAGWGWMSYLRGTDRRNLFLDPQPTWDANEARRRSIRIEGGMYREASSSREPLRVVLLGARVAAAFGMYGRSHYEWRRWGGVEYALVPHPSGLNRVWNDPAERVRARAFLEGLLP